MDPFDDDLFAVAAAKPAPARSKFLPKAKPGPKKGPSALKPRVASARSSVIVPASRWSSGRSSGIEKANAPATGEKVARSGKPGLRLGNAEPVASERGGDVAMSESNVRALDSSPSFPVAANEIPSGGGDPRSSFAKSAQENGDVVSHLESLDGLLSASMNNEGNEPFSSHSDNVEMDTNAEKVSGLSVQNSPVSSHFMRPKKASVDNAADGEGRESSRNLRNRVAEPRLVDESGGDARDEESFDPQPNSSMNGEGGVGEKKKATTKSRAIKCKDGKPSRKRKGAEDASEQPKEEPKKKFPRSTRRSRRVDKALLETPEEEIDYRRLKIPVLLLLAAHNERSARKSTARSTKSSNGPSVVGNASDAVEARNYQSFMEKTPGTRWSEQATELFYEGMRQFGTDLSMIKQLFPNLTREQVKRKYNKEERQNRSRLSDALESPAKDHKLYEFVIERLLIRPRKNRSRHIG